MGFGQLDSEDSRVGKNDIHDYRLEERLMQAELPGQIMRMLWDGFCLAVDQAMFSCRFNDVIHAANCYGDLIKKAESLPDNQAEFWVERADGYLPAFWMVWMQWLDEWENVR